MLELEMKAVVPDAETLRARLQAAGATRGRTGLMRDRRLDHDGRFGAKDEVIRVRSYEGGTEPCTVLAWKGPTSFSVEGFKQREEVEFEGRDDAETALRIFAALGFEVVHAIDRRIETWHLGAATLRLEWYPRMDVLVEVEGPAEALEAAMAATGYPREAFSTDSLSKFTARYRERTGRAHALSEADLRGAPAVWGP